MDQFRQKLLTVQLQDTTECINKEKKLQQIQLRQFSLGQEDFSTEQN
jgi:hypothetical protein